MKKIYCLLAGIIWLASNVLAQNAQPDPNFHIYLCFGQSNMEGNAAIGADDRTGVSDRFKVLTVAPQDEAHIGRTEGQWYTATAPLCRWNTGLTPADYFGRTLTDSLPDSIRIGVVMVAMGGSGIDAFDKDNYTQYYQNADAWQKSLMDIYGGNPYAKLIEMAKLAQQDGVIKGVLLHQGETNTGQTDWPLKVKKIYYDMLTDLDIEANSIPLLAGEMLYQNQGGVCWGMNSIVANLPAHIPNSHIISSEGLAGTDDYHFTTEGARELGRRYGLKLLELSKTYTTVEGQTVDHLALPGTALTLLTGTAKKLPLTAVYADGHTEDISYKATYDISNTNIIQINNGSIESLLDGTATVTASFQGTLGGKQQLTFTVAASTFPLSNQLFDATIWEAGTFDETTKTLQTGQWGFGGWTYQSLDLSGYNYLVARLGSNNTAGAKFRLFDGNSYWGKAASYDFGNERQVVVNLNEALKEDGTPLDISHIYIVGFWSTGGSPFVIDSVFLSNSTEYATTAIGLTALDDTPLAELSGFGYQQGQGPSASQGIKVSGTQLGSDVLIEAPTNFEIGQDTTQAFASSLTLSPDDGQLAATTLWVRLAAGLAMETYTGELTVSSEGATGLSIALQGTVAAAVGINDQVGAAPTVLSVQYYTLAGQEVQAPADQTGIFIVKKQMSDGSVVVTKTYKAN